MEQQGLVPVIATFQPFFVTMMSRLSAFRKESGQGRKKGAESPHAWCSFMLTVLITQALTIAITIPRGFSWFST
jgi:hypothetical protein